MVTQNTPTPQIFVSLRSIFIFPSIHIFHLCNGVDSISRIVFSEKERGILNHSLNSRYLRVGVFFRHHRSMNNRRLHRANSFIRARKERAGNLFKKQHVTKLQRYANKPDRVSSFLTIPNAFRQCTVTLPIIHSAIPRFLREKLPDCSPT